MSGAGATRKDKEFEYFIIYLSIQARRGDGKRYNHKIELNTKVNLKIHESETFSIESSFISYISKFHGNRLGRFYFTALIVPQLSDFYEV